MTNYDLLSGITILEVAQFGPDATGGFLADLGARVIKVEEPCGGDPIRHAGPKAIGTPDGIGYLHLRWNRGKQSIALDLASDRGKAAFRRLAAKADAVVEGMRAGVLDRMGLSLAALQEDNPRLVFCSVSGMGRSGPYSDMASHGPSFDAFAGIGQPLGPAIGKYDGPQPASIGMYAVGIYAALGLLAAVVEARRTGRGRLVEVAAAEAAAHWLPEALDPLMNPDLTFDRPGFADASGRMRLWARMDNYRCRDGRLIFLQSLTDKSWRSLVELLGRPDLDAIYARQPQTGNEDREVAAQLHAIFATRDRDEWLALFRPANIAAMPVNTPAETIVDPHFAARSNIYARPLADGRVLRLTGTPIRVEGAQFAPPLPPMLDEHGPAIRAEFDLQDF